MDVPGGRYSMSPWPEQRLRAHLIENRARVHPGGDLERDARRDVRLDEAGDHIDRRPLRRQDQMNAGGARLLRQARDELLDLLADDHHEIGELVDDHHDERAAWSAPATSSATTPGTPCAIFCSWIGSLIGLPASAASFTLRLKPPMLRTPSADMSW